MNRMLLVMCILAGLVNKAHAQKMAPQGKWKFKVRQSFESTDLKSEPAAVLLTFPYQTSASYAVDGAVAIERESERFFGKVIGEYHRNTLIDKEQNNGQIGLGAEYYLRDLNDTNIISNYILTGTAKYVRDVVASKGSFLHTLELSPFSPTFNTPIRAGGPNANYVLISPSVGYEYQNTFSAKPENLDSLRGNILRGTGKVRVSLTLNKRITVAGPETTKAKLFEDSSGILVPTKKRFLEMDPAQSVVVPAVQLYASGAMRYDLVNTTETPAGWHPFLQAGIDYILTRNKAHAPQLSVGLSLVTGQNPAQGLAEQKYWLLAVRFTL